MVQYPAFSYDDKDLDITLSNISEDQLKICDACGKPFLPSGRNAWRMRYCPRKHYIKCKICGSIADITPNKVIPNTCGKKCNGIFKARQMQATMVERYGVSNPSQVVEFKEKAKASNALHKDETMQKIRNTMIERYGAAIPRQVPKLREKIDKTMVERYGVVNPSHNRDICNKISQRNKSAEVQDKYKATSFAHYGTEYPAQNPNSPNSWGNIKDKFESTMLNRYGTTTSFAVPECREKSKQTCLEKYGYEYSSQSPEVHKKQWNTRKDLRGCDGTPLDSSYEVTVYNFWKSLGLEIERNIPLKFEYNGKTHITFIDFRVDGIFFETKGKPHLAGVYDYNQSVPIDQKLKVYRENHVILITDSTMSDIFGHKDSKESNGLKHLDICPNPLIGVDISLFEDSPEFPFATNKPKCFYAVSVNGCPPQYDAFYDKKIRWNIIKNRIQYVGGFIDAKEILVGLNVTRKAKQPSWFSKSLATRLIKTYCSMPIIYDLAAGWGTRCDACRDLHRTYIACDFNKELVDWHHEHDRNTIVWHDGRTFTYDSPCSIFICPPYSDPKTGNCFEDYNFDGFDESVKSLTQCQWLMLAMKNAPNFVDATMVCKIVDLGWEKYIVETIDNKSHFGTNCEYVIHITKDQYLSEILQ
jgi:hypothetical protein